MKRFVVPALVATLLFSVCVGTASAAVTLTANSDHPCLITVTTPSPLSFERFGDHVALSGDTMAVTANPVTPVDATSPLSGPAIDVFVRSAEGWSLQQEMVLPLFSVEQYEATAIALDGNRLAVATGDGVHVFDRAGGTWTETALISGLYAFALALDGDTMAIGSPIESDSVDEWNPVGATRIFVHDGAGWSLQQRLAPEDGKEHYFGQSLVLHGDFLAIGAPGEQEGRSEGAGAVYTYGRVDGVWTKDARIVSPDPMVRGVFGNSLALDGDRLAISMYGWESQTGAVYVFDQHGATWTPSARIAAPDGRPGNLVDYGGDSFGISMVLSGDTLAVGAPEDDDSGSNSGSVYILRKVDSDWVFQRKIAAPGTSTNGYFGMVLACDNGRVAVGMYGSGDGSGSVHAFDLGLMTPVDTTLTVPLDALLANDSIPAGMDVAVSKSAAPGHGTLADEGDEGFTYTPTADWSGSDAFAYSLRDGSAVQSSLRVSATGSAVATVAVGVWQPTELTLTASSVNPAYSGSTTLRVKLATQTGVPVAGRTVAFEVQSGTKWVSVGTRKTGSTGAASLTVSGLTSARNYRVRTSFSDTYGAASARLRVAPRVSIGTPSAPSSVRKNRSFTVSSTLKPRHTAGTKPVLIRCYRWQGGAWVLMKSVAAKVKNYSSYSKYTATVSLPSTGKWRLYAYHPSDGSHAATTSGRRSVTVK